MNAQASLPSRFYQGMIRKTVQQFSEKIMPYLSRSRHPSRDG
jgi:hypothetical protein